MFSNTKFILASSSSSRFKILKKNKLSFVALKPICNEGLVKKKLIKEKIKISKICLTLARLKAKSISLLHEKNLIVGSDTIIDFMGAPLSKAKNLKEAKLKILQMSGKSHNIHSSVSVFYKKKEIWNSSQTTIVKFRSLTEGDVDVYLSCCGNKILSSVGCFQLEEMGPNIIENIKGDFFNVLGFPLFPFLNFIKKYKTEKK